MQPLFDRFDTRKMIIQPEEGRILGDWAYSHGTYEFETAPKEGGEPRTCSGKFLHILEKQVDGSWKIATDCHNHSTPSE
jgi:ketosteroid isomerase-like protein